MPTSSMMMKRMLGRLRAAAGPGSRRAMQRTAASVLTTCRFVPIRDSPFWVPCARARIVDSLLLEDAGCRQDPGDEGERLLGRGEAHAAPGGDVLDAADEASG